MSTGYANTKKVDKSKNITAIRIAELAKMGEVLFHTQDLETLWQIKNKNNLYATIMRYVKSGLLFRIYRGVYSLREIKNINGFLLGIKCLNTYAYISLESVLFEKGIIFQAPSVITMVSSKSKKFSVENSNYQSRQLSSLYLYNKAGIYLTPDGYLKATTERAIADILHFNPNYYFDSKTNIDWNSVKEVQKAIGYAISNK